MKKLLLMFCVFSACSVNDDIRFISPKRNDFVSGTLIIKIAPPSSPDVEAAVWVEKKSGFNIPMWGGTLNKENNYTFELDISGFELGAYVIAAGSDDYDAGVDFWIE